MVPAGLRSMFIVCSKEKYSICHYWHDPIALVVLIVLETAVVVNYFSFDLFNCVHGVGV